MTCRRTTFSGFTWPAARWRAVRLLDGIFESRALLVTGSGGTGSPGLATRRTLRILPEVWKPPTGDAHSIRTRLAMTDQPTTPARQENAIDNKGSSDSCVLLDAEEQIDAGERARRYAAEVRKAYRPLEVGQD